MSLPRASTRTLTGWGLYPAEECAVYRPERVEEIGSIVASAPEARIISRGMGRSYGDAALNAGHGVILHQRLDRFLEFDEATATIRCEAAATLAEIIDHMLPRGYFLPITPGTKHISLGGAIAADVHGKNHHRDGTISTQVVDFRILTAGGKVLSCSRDENPELFWATLGGMGLTGAILDARLRLRPVETAYLHTQTLRCANIDEALDRILEGDRDYDYAVAWIDCLARGRSLGRSVLLRANPAPLADLPIERRDRPHHIDPSLPFQVPFKLPAIATNRFNMRLFNEFWWAIHPNREAITNYQSYFYPLDAVRHWNRVYGDRGVLQWQAVLPRETCRDGLVEILEPIAKTRRASFLAVLKSTGPANQSPLSFPIEGASLAIDFANTGEEIFELLARLDRIVLARGGRVYLAKDACVKPEIFREMYPELPRFQEVKAKYDPEERFVSSLARRLGIVEGA